MTDKAKRSLSRRLFLASGAAITAAAAVGVGYLAAKKGGRFGPGASRARPVRGNDALPAEIDVVVIGGGNIGCLTALNLAERGVKVLLCEKGVIAGEASGRSLGYVDSLFLDPSKAEIVHRSKLLWSQMNARVSADTGYRQCGVAALFDSEEALAQAKGWADSVRDVPGADARMLGRQEAAALAVGSADRIAGALHIPTDAVVEPQWAAPAIAEQVRRLKGAVVQNCAVRGIETTNGRVSAVITEKGPVKCGSIVVACGIWSPTFLQSLDLDLPQFMAFGYAMRFASGAGPTTALVATYRNLVMRAGAGGYFDACRPVASTPITPSTLRHLHRLLPAWQHMSDQLDPVLNVSTFLSLWRMPTHWPLDQPSPFEKIRILVPEIRHDMLNEVALDMRSSFPAIAASGEVERWSGAMMSTLDNMPVISAVNGRPVLFIGSGFYYGLTMAPAAGEALADLVMGHRPQIDLGLYRFSRFTDGSPIQFRD